MADVGGWIAAAGVAMMLAGALLFWVAEGPAIFAQAVLTSFLNCF